MITLWTILGMFSMYLCVLSQRIGHALSAAKIVPLNINITFTLTVGQRSFPLKCENNGNVPILCLKVTIAARPLAQGIIYTTVLTQIGSAWLNENPHVDSRKTKLFWLW